MRDLYFLLCFLLFDYNYLQLLGNINTIIECQSTKSILSTSAQIA